MIGKPLATHAARMGMCIRCSKLKPEVIHVIASAAKQSISQRYSGEMDCFAALAMTLRERTASPARAMTSMERAGIVPRPCSHADVKSNALGLELTMTDQSVI